MPKKLAGSFVNLVHEAAARSFHRRKALARFLRQAGVSEKFLAGWTPDESKRDLLDRLFAALPTQALGDDLVLRMARDLAAQTAFPDLHGWENSAMMLQSAGTAVKALKIALEQIDDQVLSEKERKAARERFAAFQEELARSRDSLESLDRRLKELATRLGSQEAGYAFQDWFYDLMDFSEVQNRRPYVTDGRQIDGSITVAGTTYLVETKFTKEQATGPDIDVFFKKVTDKADNTMGVMVSISGYSGPAVDGASVRQTPLLLMDHRHLYLALGGTMSFGEIVERVRRHASQTGEALLPPERF